MPILEREIDLFPETLLWKQSGGFTKGDFAGGDFSDGDFAGDDFAGDDFAKSSSGEQSRWWVLYTLPRKEKELMRQLVRYAVPFYGPVVEKKYRSRGGRVRTSYIPLFSNYIFIYANAEERVQALKTNCVIETISVAKQDEFLSDLRAIHSLIASKSAITVESKLQPGRKVRVKTGPLKGREGVVLERRGVERLVVMLNILQQGVSTLLQDFIVEPID